MPLRRSAPVALALCGIVGCEPLPDPVVSDGASAADATPDPALAAARFDPTADGFVARNPMFASEFLVDGVAVRRLDGAAFGLLADGWGRDAAMVPFEPVVPVVAAGGARVEYRREDTVAWWVNDAAGLEQGFDILVRPSGSGPLIVRTRVTGAALEAERDGVWLYPDEGGQLLYTGAAAWDDLGNPLPISLEVDGDRIALVVDDREAIYPITVDPLVLDVSWTVDGGSASAAAGTAVAALDFNGDGTDDLAVGAPGSGEVRVYFGGSSLGTTAGWTLAGTAAAATGAALTAINLDATGSEDLVVGEPGSGAGQVRVFFGATGTPDTTADVTLSGATSGDAFGSALAVGDLTGSGSKVDLVVGAPSASSGAGKAYVYAGDGTTLATTSAWSVTGATSEKFGTALAVGTFKTALAVVVGAPGATNGKVYTYEKSGSNLSTSVTTTLTGTSSGDQFGAAVAAGNFASGSQDDLLVGSPSASASVGKADVFAGSTGGLKTTTSWSVTGTLTGGRLGAAVAAGLDAEGSARTGVVVAAPAVSGDSRYQGGVVYYYKGSSGTISTTVTRVIEAGQEGAAFGTGLAFGAFTEATYGDLVVGSPSFENTASGEGRAWVFLGNRDADSDGSPTGEDCDDGSASRTPYNNETYQSSWSSSSTTDLDCDGFELYRILNDSSSDGGSGVPQISTVAANYDATSLVFSFTYAMASSRAYIWYFDTGESGGETAFLSSSYSGDFPSSVTLDTAADFMVATYGGGDLFAYDLTDGDSVDVSSKIAKIYRNSYSTASGQGYVRVTWDQLYGLGEGVVPVGAKVRILGVVRDADDSAPSDVAPDNATSPYATWVTLYVDLDNDGAPDTTTEPFQDGDGDKYDVALEGDCDDSLATVHPGATDTMGDGVDGDCDGAGGGDSADDDGDGIDYGDETAYGSSDANADDDGDGIPTRTEGTVDTDGDGTANFLDSDSDADGIADSVEGSGDIDSSGGANYLDTDADGDGILDATEGSADIDGDKLGNFLDTDADGDTLLDKSEGRADSDKDGVGDYLDPDDDGDAVLTFYEIKFSADPHDEDSDDDLVVDGQEWDYAAYVVGPETIDQLTPQNTDGDKLIDALDPDDDDDGYDTIDEGDVDVDGSGDCDDPGSVSIVGDGWPNYLDLDSDGDKVADGASASSTCGTFSETLEDDKDGDGAVNMYDYCDCDGGAGDSDGDGLSSKDERDKKMSPSNPDSDRDGVFDGLEVTHSGLKITDTFDTDGDKIIDALDTDDDGDTTLTLEELGDAVDTDGDGFDDVFLDTDGDGADDYLDEDDDGDGVDSIDELVRENSFDGSMGQDSDGDGLRNSVDANDFDGPLEDEDHDGLRNDAEASLGSTQTSADSDHDGVPDPDEVGDLEARRDNDGDLVLDILDPDDDGDGHPTLIEGAFDIDQDGTANHLDTDADGDGLADASEGTDDADADNVPDWLDADPDDGPASDIHVRPDAERRSGWRGEGCATAPTAGGPAWLGLLAFAAIFGRQRRRS